MWDAIEPQYAGLKVYEESVLAIADAFSKTHGVEVVLHFVTRQEIDDYLAGQSEEEDPPALVYSTEWPALHETFACVPAYVDPDSYLDAAIAYWEAEGRLLGIPAYIHWIGTAVDASLLAGEQGAAEGESDETESEQGEAAGGESGDSDEPDLRLHNQAWLEQIKGKVGYWHDSPAFLPSVLDWPGVGWAGSLVVQYLDWVKETCGPIREDPLAAWQDEEVRALCPVTPYLQKWLNASGESSMRIFPIAGPFSSPRYYYTVPGYAVLAGEEEKVACAAMLGKELAANLGRWAARALGAIPALADDLPLFHLESDSNYEWRIAVLKELEPALLKAPTAGVAAQRARTEEVVARLSTGYHNGTVSREELEREIDGILATHTRP